MKYPCISSCFYRILSILSSTIYSIRSSCSTIYKCMYHVIGIIYHRMLILCGTSLSYEWADTWKETYEAENHRKRKTTNFMAGVMYTSDHWHHLDRRQCLYNITINLSVGMLWGRSSAFNHHICALCIHDSKYCLSIVYQK